MTALTPIPAASDNLPGLIDRDRAATMLASAKTAAEVLEAREAAGLAYDVAKRAARLKSAKAAHGAGRCPGNRGRRQAPPCR